MNAGGHGAETSDTLVAAEVVSLSGEPARRTRKREELDFSYRHSALSEDEVVVSARFSLTPGDPAASNARIQQIVRWRRENQPGGQNAGSVFTNPPGDSAGRLVDEAGLKGFRIGTAAVSEKHANFIQADPGGSADDVWRVVQAVRRQVAAATGIELELEVRFMGPAGSL
jgi:UDP-N-acetylmuramate dehydrogenase